MSTAKKRRIAEPESTKKKRKSDAKESTKSPASKDLAATRHHSSSKPTSPTVSAKCSLYIPIPPIYALDPVSGICDSLNSLVMQYVPQLDGVLLAYDSIAPSSSARIINDSPFAHVWVTFQATIWRPSIGQILVGRINQQSPDHIGLLLQGTFNASIPREEITSVYKYNQEAEEWTVSMDGANHSLYSVSGGYVHLRVKEINRDRSGLVSVVGSLADIDTYGVYSKKFIEDKNVNAEEGWKGSHSQDDALLDAEADQYQNGLLEKEPLPNVRNEVAVHMAEDDESDFDTAALTPKPGSKKKSKKVKTEEDESSTPSKQRNTESSSGKKEKSDDGSEKKKKKKKHRIKTEQT